MDDPSGPHNTEAVRWSYVVLLASCVACGRISFEQQELPKNLADSAVPDLDASELTDGGDDVNAPSDGTIADAPTTDVQVPGTCDDTDLGTAVGNAVASGTTRGAGDDFADACEGAFGSNSPDVSFTWRAPAAGQYVFDTCGSSFDTLLTVHDGTCSGARLACSDDDGSCGGFLSSVTLTLAEGQQVVLVVDGFLESGTYVLNIQVL